MRRSTRILSAAYLTCFIVLSVKTLKILKFSGPDNLSRLLREERCNDNLGLCTNDDECCSDLICDKSVFVLGFRCRRLEESAQSDNISQKNVVKEVKNDVPQSLDANKASSQLRGEKHSEGHSNPLCNVWRSECSIDSDCCQGLTCGAYNGVDIDKRCYFVVSPENTNEERNAGTNVNSKTSSKTEEDREPNSNKIPIILTQQAQEQEMMKGIIDSGKTNTDGNIKQVQSNPELTIDWFENSIKQINDNFAAYKQMMLEREAKLLVTKSSSSGN